MNSGIYFFSSFLNSLQVFLKDVLFFPVWWYSFGVRNVFNWALKSSANLARRLAFVILLRNLFRPLYGDYSKVGLVIGFIFRIVYFVIISIVQLIGMAFLFLLVLLWLALPVLSLYLIIF